MTSAQKTGPDPAESARSITPRRGLPTGRAVMGALLVTAGGLGAFALATSGGGGPTASYLVAAHDLEAGASLTVTDVRFEPMELSPSLASSTLNSIDGLEGALLLVDHRAGSLIDVADVIPAAPGVPHGLQIHEVSFAVPLARTPEGVRVGDRITVLVTHEGITRLAVEDAPLIAADTTPDRIGASGQGILTLAIDDATVAMEIAHLTQVGDITIVRSTRALDDTFPDLVTTPEAGP